MYYGDDITNASEETRNLVARVAHMLAHLEYPRPEAMWDEMRRMQVLRLIQVTPDMPERLMLGVLQARMYLVDNGYEVWARQVSMMGGPELNAGSLRGYVEQVLDGVARRVDPRVREALLLYDRGIQPTPGRSRGPAMYHPGRPPAHKRWRIARKARKEAAAVYAAQLEEHEDAANGQRGWHVEAENREHEEWCAANGVAPFG